MSEAVRQVIAVDPVATRYAIALYELAREKSQLEAVSRDIAALGKLLADSAASSWIFDARVPAQAKRDRIEALAASQSPLTANFLRLVADKRRLDLLRGLPTAFRRCELQDRGAVEGHVESARPIGAGELAELCVSLGAILGKQVTLSSSLAPELIGGARILVDNRLLDLSVQGRLEGLRAKLNSARVH